MNERLYEELLELKETLQKEGIVNGKVPNVCSDEIIKLFATYRPKTKQEMLQIKGIGDAFIDKYGDRFLNVIEAIDANEVVALTDTEKEVLEKLENRLVRINKKNRLLYSSKVNNNYGIDLVKNIDNIEKVLEFIVKQSSGSIEIINGDKEEKLAKILNKLVRSNEKNMIESGNDELYIAYPFMQGKYEKDNFDVKAPLMLFPVSIKKKNQSYLLENDTSRDIVYNTTIILANNKFDGRNEILPDNSIEELNPDTYINDMLNFYMNNKVFIKDKDEELEDFMETSNSGYPNYKHGEIELKKYMILGIYSTYVTSMHEDFEKMISSRDVTHEIKDLLYGSEELNEEFKVSYDEVEDKQDISPQVKDDDILYINELDYSQEKILNEVRNHKEVVVQGPPGTGKSQVITSIVAQNVLLDKNVLMVSEKKTALDVIYSRLGKLSSYALILDDIENKDAFYNQIRGIINHLRQELSSIEYKSKSSSKYKQEIAREVARIDDHIEELNEINNKVYSINEFGTSMFNIYNKCKRIDLKSNRDIFDFNYMSKRYTSYVNKNNYDVLDNIYENLKRKEIKEVLVRYINLNNINKAINNIKQNISDMDLFDIKSKVLELDTFKKEYEEYTFIKKLANKSKLSNLVKDISAKLFSKRDKLNNKLVLENTDVLTSIIDNYSEFVSDIYVYNNLDNNTKEYISIISNIINDLKYEYDECNDLVYYYVLYSKINDFETKNPNVINYINNFERIRTDIARAVESKTNLTKELAYLHLLNKAKNLASNNRFSKIEEMCNRKRKMSINKFMDKFKFELLDSVSIWLVTPEVVSDLLPFEKGLFDMVVFDEASQLFVEKAIPSIYRAKNVVVAGDEKQLKPSSLFIGRIIDEEDEIEETDGFLNYDSLLEAANYKFRHTMLNYHYRSRYNELIAFSNYAFYHGKLFVTSVANKKDDYKPIERIMVKNGKWVDKCNLAEGKEVVKLVKDILKTREHNETIGVITFNITQTDLIEDLIDKEMDEDVEFAIAMGAEKNRTKDGENIGFFVKNIETVQGDERDIIIFCIGYAKNEKGVVSINFGLLNQDGGENRLNVAISRAKEKIYVITSIEPEELVVDSTKNDGPKLFKEYLRYVKACDEGDNELTESILHGLLDSEEEDEDTSLFDSVFESEVYDMLISKGYNVKTNYGVGGYRLDLVVTDKNGKNLLGIECDGRLYHTAKFSRDRDYHRQKYLESRGWHIYRIWSSNWWKNPDYEMKKLESYINTLK